MFVKQLEPRNVPPMLLTGVHKSKPRHKIDYYQLRVGFIFSVPSFKIFLPKKHQVEKYSIKSIIDNFSFRMSADKPNPGDAAPQVDKLVRTTISSQSTCKEINYFQ